MLCPRCGTAIPQGVASCGNCSLAIRYAAASDATVTIHGDAARTETIEIKPRHGVKLANGTEIAGRYQVIRALGEGGMGAVYQTWDRELEKVVAVKVIHSDLASEPGILQRFKQELILARQIHHANVIQIFDIGHTDDLYYISMDFVDGRDLSGVLKERGKLPPLEAAEMIRHVCRGLEAAHAERVIHRDLKPQNIMIATDGEVTVMDFGIARAADSSDMTQTGTLIGTPTYMSPEQAIGSKIDTRSDIFSVGIIFYELLTGTVPFKAESAMGTLTRRCQEKAQPPIEVEPSLPRALNDIVVRALATDREQRYQTAGELIQDLDRWIDAEKGVRPPDSRAVSVSWKWISVLAAAIFGISMALWFAPKPKKLVSNTVQKSILLLVSDFENSTGDPLFDGTLESMIAVGLEGASFLTSYDRVAAHKLAAQLRAGATRLDLSLSQLLAKREGIDGIIVGAVSREGDGYRLIVKAIDAATGKEIGNQDSGKISKENVLAAVGKLVAPLRKLLGDKSPESKLLNAGETFTSTSLDAMHKYALAQEYQWKGKLAEATKYYESAIQADPDFGRAYAGLAVMHMNVANFAESSKYYEQALARMSHMTDREKYRTRGGYYLLIRADERAVDEFSALVRDYPGDTAGLANLAMARLYRRDLTHAIEDGRRAVTINPKNVIRRNNLALYQLYAGNFAEAEQEARRVLELNPDYEKAFEAIALAQLGNGNVDESRQTWTRLASVSPFGASRSADGLADIALYEGDLAGAAQILEKGIVADDAIQKPDWAARKRLALASARLDQGRPADAIGLTDHVVAHSKQVDTLFSAALIYLRAQKGAKVRQMAEKLGSHLEPESRSYAKLIEGLLLLNSGKPVDAISLIDQAGKLSDNWLVHFVRGRAELGANSAAEALRDAEICLQRRGEATSVFLDEVPTYRYLPPVLYIKARAQDMLNNPAAVESYKSFLAIHGKARQDADVVDANRRLGTLTHQ